MNNTYYILFGILLFILGGISSFLSFETIQTPNITEQTVKIYDTPHTFFGILSNNLFVGILVSFGGYFCCGILTVVIFLYNGYVLAEIIQTAIHLNISHDDILYGLIFHGPLEILSFLLFGIIGLKGWKFYLRVFKYDVVAISELKQTKSFLIPTILLIIAAFIEVNL